MAIKNIIFDFGGVFIEVDYMKTENAFIASGIKNFNELYSQHKASPLFEQLETGVIKETEFYNAIRELSKTTLTDQQIKHAWNAMLGNYLEDCIGLLENLKNKFRLILFSNTNEIHYKAFVNSYNVSIKGKPFNAYFNSAYYSHLCGFRKPGKEAFEKLLAQENIHAAETIFIDDTLINCQGAEEAGIHSIHLKPGMKLTDIDFNNLI